jgi:hypothetical protein
MAPFLRGKSIIDSHPMGQELKGYCERWLANPDAVTDDDFLRFEGHMLSCDFCQQRAMEYERGIQHRGSDELKMMAAASTLDNSLAI